jgi:hypothetical protein
MYGKFTKYNTDDAPLLIDRNVIVSDEMQSTRTLSSRPKKKKMFRYEILYSSVLNEFLKP